MELCLSSAAPHTSQSALSPLVSSALPTPPFLGHLSTVATALTGPSLSSQRHMYSGAHGGQKSGWDSLELELHSGVGCLVKLLGHSGSPGRAAHAFHH